MTGRTLDGVIESLVADARPVTPLASPARRASTTFALIALAGAVAILSSDLRGLVERHAGREMWLALQMAAILATGVAALAGAFFASIPGRSPAWSAAPIPFFVTWLVLATADCLQRGAEGLPTEDCTKCLVFITGTSALLAGPVAWRLSRAAPLDAMRVSLLAGLGIGALSAFLLHFFHPFDVTLVDLGVHVGAIMLVTGAMGVAGSRALRRA